VKNRYVVREVREFEVMAEDDLTARMAAEGLDPRLAFTLVREVYREGERPARVARARETR